MGRDETLKEMFEEITKDFDHEETVTVEMSRMEFMMIMASDPLMRKGCEVAMEELEETGACYLQEGISEMGHLPMSETDVIRTILGVIVSWNKFTEKISKLMPDADTLDQVGHIYDAKLMGEKPEDDSVH